MAIISFNVENYKVSLSHELTASWGPTTVNARGKIVCYGEEHRLIAYFLMDESPIPEPVYLEDKKVGAIFFPFREMVSFIDILRHEKPVYAYLSDEKPEWSGIGTFRAPAGEREN